MKHIQASTHKYVLMYAGTIFLIILSILAIVLAVHLSDTGRQNNQNTISVSGIGEVDAVPDVATFSFSVTETADTTEEAQAVISEKVAVILDGLEALGIAERDIRTQAYSMYPKYEWARVAQGGQEIAVDGTVYYPGNNSRQVQTGFDVRQNIELTLRDFDMIPDVLTLLGTTGVEDLSGPNFEIDEPEELQSEAREMAISDAKEKAERLARDLGVSLGDIVSFNENDGGYQPYYAKMESQMVMDSAAGNYAPELPTGENTISSSVNIVYTIK